MAVYGGARPAALNQGDLLNGVPFLVRHGYDTDEWRNYPLLGLVTSHSCDFTKFVEAEPALRLMEKEVWPLQVAPVYVLTEIEAANRRLAMEGEIRRYFPLPAESGRPDLVADLAFEQPLPVVVLDELPVLDRLSDEYVDRLHGQIVIFKTRIDLVALGDQMDQLNLDIEQLRQGAQS